MPSNLKIIKKIFCNTSRLSNKVWTIEENITDEDIIQGHLISPYSKWVTKSIVDIGEKRYFRKPYSNEILWLLLKFQ